MKKLLSATIGILVALTTLGADHKIVFIAGNPSHGRGEHEHRAGCLLLQSCLANVRGVTTVVARLFNIAGANTAYFGQKDYQQLAVIRAMVRDLHIPIGIVGVPTVREPDGLAMSSRNVRLTPDDRAAAVVLNAALVVAETMAHEGATVNQIIAAIRAKISAEPRATLKAVDIVDPLTFGPPTRDLGIMISAQFGDVLLIDQREVRK